MQALLLYRQHDQMRLALIGARQNLSASMSKSAVHPPGFCYIALIQQHDEPTSLQVVFRAAISGHEAEGVSAMLVEELVFRSYKHELGLLCNL